MKILCLPLHMPAHFHFGEKKFLFDIIILKKSAVYFRKIRSTDFFIFSFGNVGLQKIALF